MLILLIFLIMLLDFKHHIRTVRIYTYYIFNNYAFLMNLNIMRRYFFNMTIFKNTVFPRRVGIVIL